MAKKSIPPDNISVILSLSVCIEHQMSATDELWKGVPQEKYVINQYHLCLICTRKSAQNSLLVTILFLERLTVL